MGKRPDGSSEKRQVVSFTRDAAERIARAVKSHEAGDRSGGPFRSYPRLTSNPAKNIRVGKVAAAWAIGTCATVTLWERTEANCAPTAKIPTETVENVVNLAQDIPSGSWVVIGKAADGKWYLVESGIEGSCRQTIGGEDITKWSGWDGTKEQLLGHDAYGCLKWFDVEQCGDGSGQY